MRKNIPERLTVDPAEDLPLAIIEDTDEGHGVATMEAGRDVAEEICRRFNVHVELLDALRDLAGKAARVIDHLDRLPPGSVQSALVVVRDLNRARQRAAGILAGDEYQPTGNVPCKNCGRSDLPLHFNRLCPECKAAVSGA